MRSEARKRIDSHRLMIGTPEHILVGRSEHINQTIASRKRFSSSLWKKNIFVYVLISILSCIFTSGFVLLSILLWVKSDSFRVVFFTGIVSFFVFVACFAILRMIIFHYVIPDYYMDDIETGHHVAKSIAYGIIAFILMFVFIMLMVQNSSIFVL